MRAWWLGLTILRRKQGSWVRVPSSLLVGMLAYMRRTTVELPDDVDAHYNRPPGYVVPNPPHPSGGTSRLTTQASAMRPSATR